jgi:hypothetical protein
MENSSVSSVLKKLPYDLILFFIFCMAISLFSFYLNLDMNKELKTTLMPYTGWGFGRGYMTAMLFILIGLMTAKGTTYKTLQVLRIVVIILMLLNIYNGIEDWLMITPEDYTNPNPYLRYDALTPIYTIITPSFWSIVMLIAFVWTYFKNKKQQAAS